MKKIINSTLCSLALTAAALTSVQAQESKPKVDVGLLLHSYFQIQQDGFGLGYDDVMDLDDPSARTYGASLYRARVLFDLKLTDKDKIFIETDLSASVGMGTDKTASIKILDAQYDHIFSDAFTVSAGKMLTSYNRNGLQTAGTLMANDFSFFQYAYNMTQSDPLNNDCGRDIGINLSGGFNEGKLRYRLGAFSGCRDYSLYTGEESAPLRFVGRVQYNFLDVDNYSGTNLGEGKTFTLAAGFDNQGSYYAVGADLYLDAPIGDTGSITLNAAYSYMSGGNTNAKYHFKSVIADQNILFAEAGYYFKDIKIQPWVKYELQDRTIEGLADEKVFGGGVNYFFNGYGSNLRLSYVARKNSLVGSYYGQTWIQLQFFFL
ncbi:MAG: hypothetical protein SNF68_01570 [Rikenellaceae bacterium]